MGMERGGISTAASTLHGPAATLGLWYRGVGEGMREWKKIR